MMVNQTLTNITTALLNATNELVNTTGVTLVDAGQSEIGFLQTLLNPPLVLFVFSLSLVIVVMVFVIKNVMPVSDFLYANARIQARSSYMVTDNMLLELMQAKSLKEFRSLLRETIYGEELDKGADDLKEIHSSLEKGFINEVFELIELSPDKSKGLFNAYLMFFEVKILKIIYRAKLMNMKIEDGLVFPVGNIDSNLLKHLLTTQTIADIKLVMEPTMYAKIFGEEYSNLEEFEVKIDEFVLNNFVDVVKKTRMYDGKYIIDILDKKVDILNILALLKFRIRNVEKERQAKLLVHNKTNLCSRFDKLIEAETLKDFVEGFKGLLYYDTLANAFEMYEKDSSMSHFENGLYRYFKRSVIKDELKHTLGPYPLFSHLVKLELDQRNLFIISRGIDAGFSAEKTKEMVV